MLAQLVLLYLAARGHADRLEVSDDPEVARHAEVGAARLAPGDQLGLLRTLAVLQRDVRGGHFAEALIRHADHLRRLYGGMCEQHFLDLRRRDVLAADAEHILQ